MFVEHLRWPDTVLLHVSARPYVNPTKWAMSPFHRPRQASDSRGWNSHSRLFGLSPMHRPVGNPFWPLMAILWSNHYNALALEGNPILSWHHRDHLQTAVYWLGNCTMQPWGRGWGQWGEKVKQPIIFAPFIIIVRQWKQHAKNGKTCHKCFNPLIFPDTLRLKISNVIMLTRVFQTLKLFLIFKS